MTRLTCSAALAALVACCAVAAGARAQVTRATLANGLSLLIEEDHRGPSVGVAVAYGTGQRDDPPELAGLAHVVEHVMAECRGHLQEAAYARLEAIGAQAAAYTSADATVFQTTLSSEQLETVLWIEAQRMAFSLALLNETELQRIKAVVERQWETREMQHDSIDTLMLRALYPESHPYHNLIETEESLDDIELDDVQGAFQRNYSPDNAVVAVVGDVTPERVREAVERHFGSIHSSANARGWRDSVPAATPLRKTQTLTKYPGLRGLRFESLVVAWPTPALGADGDAELDILSSMLAERLQERFMRDGSVFSTRVHQHSRALASHFRVMMRVEPGHERQDVLNALENELRAFSKPSEGFARAQRRWIQSQLVDRDDLAARAGVLAESAGSRALDAARYRASSAEKVARAAEQYLVGKPHLIIERPLSRFQSTPIGVRQ